MKVIHVIPSISGLRGGPSKAVMEMVGALRDMGVDARIITTTDNGKYKSNGEDLHVWQLRKGVPVMMFSSLDSRIRFIREYLVSVSLIMWLARNVSNYDIVHFHGVFSFSSTFGMFIARWRRIPYIVRTIGQLNRWCLSQGATRKKLMMKVIERENLEHASRVHVTSKVELNDIRKLGINSKALLLGLGVKGMTQERIWNSLGTCRQDDRTAFLFLSRLHPKKRIDLLLTALSCLSNRLRDKWILYVAGDGEHEYIRSMQEYSDSVGLSVNVEWLGHVEGIEKQMLFKKVDWFVLPSASENFGISAVEAMSYGVPVIISRDVGISEDVMAYGAGYVFDGSIDELSKVIAQCVNQPSSEMRDAAELLAREVFSWEKVAKDLLGCYTTVISEKN